MRVFDGSLTFLKGLWSELRGRLAEIRKDWARRKEDGFVAIVSIVARLAGLIAMAGYLFSVVAVTIIVPFLIVWSLVD